VSIQRRSTGLIVFNSQQYSVGIDNEGKDEDATSFWGPSGERLVTVTVRKVTRKRGMSYATRQITDPTEDELGEPMEYEIHPGYRPFILGLLREIEFMTDDKLATHNCLGRAVYLQKVMDEFAEELEAAFMAVPERRRSRVLNPLLQRQLRGVSDREQAAVKSEVGDTLGASAAFYLTHDPLNPNLTKKLRRNILYIWHVRLSLSFFGHPYAVGADQKAIDNSLELLKYRGGYTDDQFDEGALYWFERRVITAEALGRFFGDLFDWVSKVEFTYPIQQIYHVFRFQPGGTCPSSPLTPLESPVSEEPAPPPNQLQTRVAGGNAPQPGGGDHLPRGGVNPVEQGGAGPSNRGGVDSMVIDQ